MIEELIEKLRKQAYKGRFSIYHRPDEVLVRTYNPDGSQSKYFGATIEEALSKAINRDSSRVLPKGMF